MTATHRGPRIRELNHRQMESVLTRNHTARLAFLKGERIELFPVHYVFSGGCLFGRTAFGTKYVSWLDGPEVVVEVDEAEGPYDWRSVIVRGSITMLRPREPDADGANYWTAVIALRQLLPDAFGEEDPTPERTAIFRIEPREMTGREAMAR